MLKKVMVSVLLLALITALSACSEETALPLERHTPMPQEKNMYTTRQTKLYKEPGGEELATIRQGESVVAYEPLDGWSKVIYQSQTGYLESANLTREKPDSLQVRAQEILAQMTMEEKVGQMFFVRCNAKTALEDIKRFHLGGYILFAADTQHETKESLTKKIKSYQDAAKIDMLIGVDEEGGTVTRLSTYKQFRAVPFHSPQSLYTEGGFPLIQSDTKEKCELLRQLGFNVNLAPVADVSVNKSDFIYPRTFGKNAAQTAEYVKTVVEIMNEQTMGAALKHFPGYGNNVDTHTGIAIDNREYASFQKSDFLPFKAGIEAGVGSILVSHNIVNCMDPELPASLSPRVHQILRNELGFEGIIMTDDLAMDAIHKYIGDSVSAELAIEAGNDLILASDYASQIPSVIESVKSGKISESRLDESVLRILMWKLKLNIIS